MLQNVEMLFIRGINIKMDFKNIRKTYTHKIINNKQNN